MPKDLITLEQEAEGLLFNAQNSKNDGNSAKYWKALVANLQEQTKILKTQTENLKRQIR